MQVQQLLRALQHMHDERGIMHGDIKPDNLMIVGAPPPSAPLPVNNYCSAVLKIGDFGLAKQLQASTRVQIAQFKGIQRRDCDAAGQQ